jgi:hypothetical protein
MIRDSAVFATHSVTSNQFVDSGIVKIRRDDPEGISVIPSDFIDEPLSSRGIDQGSVEPDLGTVCQCRDFRVRSFPCCPRPFRGPLVDTSVVVDMGVW